MTSLFIVTMFLQMKKVSNNPMSGPQSSILRKAYVDDVVCILPFTHKSFFFKKNLILRGGRWYIYTK